MYKIKFNGKYIGKGAVDWRFKLVEENKALPFDSRQQANEFISYMGLSIYDSRIEIVEVV